DSPGAPGEIRNRSLQFVDVSSEGAETVDTSAENEEPSADGIEAPDSGLACGRVCASVSDTTRESCRGGGSESRYRPVARQLVQHAVRRHLREAENRSSKAYRRHESGRSDGD